MRHGQYHVAGLHSGSHNSEAQRVRTTANGDRMACATEGCKCLLKFLDHRAANEACSEQSLAKHAGKLLLEFPMRRNQVKKRYVFRISTGNAHFYLALSR